MLASFINKFVRQGRRISSCSGRLITRHHKYSAEKPPSRCKPINIALIGLGDFSETPIDNLQKLPHLYKIAGICSKTQDKVSSVARRLNVEFAVTDYHKILENDNIDAVMILTRHDLHVPIAVDAVKAGKAVFVEKPLATTSEQLEQLSLALARRTRPFMVGFNRRYSKHVLLLKETLKTRHGPIVARYRVNSKNYRRSHWMNTKEGGGIIVGHLCHVFDLFGFILEAEYELIQVTRIEHSTERHRPWDNVVIDVRFTDGSVVSVLNTTMGNRLVSKDYCEIFCEGAVLVMDNYKSTRGYGVNISLQEQDQAKGYLRELEAFAQAVQTNDMNVMDISSIVKMTKLTIDMAERLKYETNFTIRNSP